MGKKSPEKSRKKLGFANDEFDDFRSAAEDSDDVNYNPSGAGKKKKPAVPQKSAKDK